ncbi:MAG: hypothetical protein ABL925_09340 [Methylococcales bacterium]
MEIATKQHRQITALRFIAPVSLLSAVSVGVNASILQAAGSGTFTMSLDRAALAPYFGYYLSTSWDSAASDYNNPINTGDYLVSHITGTEISAIKQVFPITATGSDPSGQPANRFVKATSANFGIDSDALTGVPGAVLGMTGVQGFWASQWLPNPSGLVNGDFSLTYTNPQHREAVWQSLGATGVTSTGWHLDNNIYFTMPVYELSNLSVIFIDAVNWQLSGDLLMSAENGWMLKGAQLNDVGNFCLGIGSFAGCSPAPVPIPAALWLFAGALLSLVGFNRYSERGLTA